MFLLPLPAFAHVVVDTRMPPQLHRSSRAAAVAALELGDGQGGIAGRLRLYRLGVGSDQSKDPRLRDPPGRGPRVGVARPPPQPRAHNSRLSTLDPAIL